MRRAAAVPAADDPLADHETPALKRRLYSSLVFLVALMYLSMGHMMWGWPAAGLSCGKSCGDGACTAAFDGDHHGHQPAFFHQRLQEPVAQKRPTWIRWWRWAPRRSFVYSVYALFAMTGAQARGDMAQVMGWMHEFYFESAAMILTLITVGKMLEARSKGKHHRRAQGADEAGSQDRHAAA